MKRFFTSSLCVSIVLLNAGLCPNESTPKQLWLDTSFNKDEVASIERAVRTWNDFALLHTDQTLFSIVGTATTKPWLTSSGFLHTKYNVIYRSDDAELSSFIARTVQNCEGPLGLAWNESVIVFMRNVPDGKLRSAALTRVVAHELGHAFLGMQHSKNDNDVMYPRLNVATILNHGFETYDVNVKAFCDNNTCKR